MYNDIKRGFKFMIKFLIKLFIKDSENIKNTKVREKYSLLCGILGIINNLILFFIKAVIGFISGSVALFSDAFNNFSDMGTSVVTIIGIKLSNQEADKDHPFGHGRIEYIASLVISFIIMLVGFELLKESFIKILNPSTVTLSLPLTLILIISVIIKLWMYSYNKFIGKKINSKVIMAASKDSVFDAVTTFLIITVSFFGKYLSFPIDGYLGVIVSLFIMYSGFLIAKDTINTLLGSVPDNQTVKEIEDTILSHNDIKGIHDLIIHDYGPGRIFASVHAEVPQDISIVKIHETIDDIENLIEKNLGVHIVIHMDPIIEDSDQLNEINNLILETLCEIDTELSFHDLRLTKNENLTNVVFDLCIPISYKEYQRKHIIDKITDVILKRDDNFNTVIKIDNKY